MIPDVIQQKILIVKNCLHQIRTTTELNPESLDVQLIQDAFVLNLQRAVQAVIDIASFICSRQDFGIPGTYKQSFEILHQNRIIPASLAISMKAMCGFRNIAVHDYQKINPEILKSILTKELFNLETFYLAVITFYEGRL